MTTGPDPEVAGDTRTPPPSSHPRIEVVRGGSLSVEQTAALTVAIAAHATTAGAPARDDADHAWARAARIEASGRPRIDRPSDLDRPDR